MGLVRVAPVGSDEAGVRRRGWTAVAVLVAFVCAFALPAVAAAEEFVVNSNDDQTDATPGDEFCVTEGGKCTLRAAIEEANALGGFNSVVFEEEDLFDGEGSEAVITPATPLPTIVAPLYIHGTQCTRTSGLVGPCAGIVGQPGASALKLENAPESEIEWLSITGAKTGIEVRGSNRVRIFSSWLGVTLDGSAGPNGTGVFYGPGSDRARVGAFTAGLGNLFANNTAVGLDLLGASEAVVQGNRFGVGLDGSTPAANGEDIEVTSDTSGGGVAAAGNEIGGRVEAGSAAGPCDRECNLISGAVGTGLDLQGEEGEDEGPAVGTSVVGNYFGLTASGGGSVPNAGTGLRVGSAERTVIGGPKAGDANRFSGGSTAVEAGPGAPDLVVRGNLVGVDGLGGTAPPPAQGIAIDSNGLASPALEAILAGNELRMDGGVGIDQLGFGAWIFGNEISGAATGIRVAGGGAQGNLIEANTVAASGQDAILVESELNDVVGNRVAGAGGAGIAVRGEPPFGISGNLIGGDAAGEENEVVGASGPAIAIENSESSITTVARNRGAANGGLFIDLLAATAGEAGPNEEIAPPTIISASSVGAIGVGAPGATVRVFRKQTSLAGEIEGFLGTATVDEDGNWALTYGVALPADTAIAASQTSKAGGTSELALKASVGDRSGSDAGPGDSAVPRDRRPPRTAILKGPKARVSSRTVRFRFASDENRTRFQCRLDGKRFRTCESPVRFGGLRPGRHVFAVRAVDAAGNADPSPAKRAFTILEAR